MYDSIVDTRLSIHAEMDFTPRYNLVYQTNFKVRSHLATQMLLYDKIVIPTNDFGIIPILINWMGIKTFRESLEADTFAFIKKKNLLGYSGGGGGLCEFTMHPGKKKEWYWWQAALFGDTQLAIEQQLKILCPFIDKNGQNSVQEEVLDRTHEFSIDKDFFKQNVINETLEDIANNQNLTKFVFKDVDSDATKIDLYRLHGINENQMRVSSYGKISDPINLLLRIAEINYQIIIGLSYGESDLFISDGAEELLKSKIRRSDLESNLIEGFGALLELNAMPDIGEAIIANSIPFSELWKLRNRSNSKKFRKWLREIETNDTEEMQRLYVASLENKSIVESLPVRILRFALTASIGAVDPVLGLSVGVVDSFFVNEWLSGYSPKLFLDELNDIKGYL